MFYKNRLIYFLRHKPSKSQPDKITTRILRQRKKHNENKIQNWGPLSNGSIDSLKWLETVYFRSPFAGNPRRPS